MRHLLFADQPPAPDKNAGGLAPKVYPVGPFEGATKTEGMFQSFSASQNAHFAPSEISVLRSSNLPPNPLA
ncbi:MAG: hypothetical protein AAFN10_14485 [Bacteroidota bacterium]